ncbi:MAG TPA: hypothetical protein VLB84_16840 [Bacteroidia bacterium]|nr:hypothetical protein [Bacteroidia bacterium]
MYLGLPIITFDVSYNRTTTENKARYFKTADELKTIVNETSIENLKLNAGLMKRIAERRYTWSLIATKYDELIQECMVVDRKKGLFPNSVKTHYELLKKHKAAHLKHSYFFYEKR